MATMTDAAAVALRCKGIRVEQSFAFVTAFKPLWCLACFLALMLLLPHSLYGNQAIYF